MNGIDERRQKGKKTCFLRCKMYIIGKIEKFTLGGGVKEKKRKKDRNWLASSLSLTLISNFLEYDDKLVAFCWK